MEARTLASRVICTLLLSAAIRGGLPAQPLPDSTSPPKLKIYLDCSSCDLDYIRRELTFVDYVRDPMEADLHILVTSQGTGGGGTEYTLSFIGRRRFAGLNDTLPCYSRKTDTDDMRRSGILRTLRLGLVHYMARTPQAAAISVAVDSPPSPDARRDPWDAWVLNTGVHGYLNGQEAHHSSYVQGSASANRTTEALKIRLSGNVNYSEDTYDYDSDGERLVVESYSRGWNLNGMAVKALTPHWSAGGWISSWSSTYSNVKVLFELKPAIEYDIFPYSQSTRQQLRILYKAGVHWVTYHEETVYDKTAETLSSEELSVSLNLKEPWGSVYASMHGSHFFHDFNKYNLNFSLGFSVRLVEGLSADFDGSIEKPHDQLGLPKRGATSEEILLQRRELETQYSYWMSFGVSFTFGSIFNNIVNPRFGGS